MFNPEFSLSLHGLAQHSAPITCICILQSVEFDCGAGGALLLPSWALHFALLLGAIVLIGMKYEL